MQIDAHQHFWRYDAEQYGWISEEMAILRRDFLPDDLAPLLTALDFAGAVAVQARQSLKETEWLLRLADQYPFIKGVVGWVDLQSPEVEKQLEAVARHPKLCGVRHVVQDEPDDRFLLRPEFRRGIARLRDFGLTYDLLIYPRHLPAAITLVEAFPEQPFVLDHIAKPDIGAGVLSPWQEDVRELARLPNVSCKLSGMVTETHWGRWQLEDFTPYLDVVFTAFGPDRLLIGSDWPVCTLSGDYASVLGIVIDYLAPYPEETRQKVLGSNAARFYNLTA